ncbi:jg14165 [Pararge aegeria aegeria]|uniref:Jg14165 protein n=1 Tax=Pararge aegeria aegeria TaxID=348720 RepID=A0A8S4QS60_9NEOP|nr:jg14165 [Pararge aegeria aegeria]
MVIALPPAPSADRDGGGHTGGDTCRTATLASSSRVWQPNTNFWSLTFLSLSTRSPDVFAPTAVRILQMTSSLVSCASTDDMTREWTG